MANASPIDQLKDFCQKYLVTKAPYTLPQNVKETLVKIAPWVTIVVFVLTLPLVLAVLGLGVLFAPFMAMSGAYGYGYNVLSLLLLAATVVLQLMAVPGLFKRQMGAWNLVFYAVLLRAGADLLSLQIFSAILSVLSLYILFQIRSLYK